MGFYGNLTNTARTQFQFDRTYPNRYSMERNIATDGIYLGRYVLVEYDAEIHEDNLKIIYSADRKFYTTIDCTQEIVFNKYKITQDTVTNLNFADYFIEENEFHYPADGYSKDTVYYELETGDISNGIEKNEIVQSKNLNNELTGQFWRCIGSNTAGNAIFEEITEEYNNNFFMNYQIDMTYYGPRSPEGAYSRAWDSTVWQKIYSEGEVKYQMIAELNAGHPGFSITYDAPTQTPLAPHVDGASNNGAYVVHLQPTWGFRIKEAENEDHSDLQVYHINSIYDTKTNSINQNAEKVNGAIYFNKKGFDETVSTHDLIRENYIVLSPTGQSGLKYNNHKGYIATKDTVYQQDKQYYTYDTVFKDYVLLNPTVGAAIEDTVYEYGVLDTYDINELDISIPAFGNAIADFYDKMYGYNPYNNNKRYRDIEWKYCDEHGLNHPDISLGGMTYDRSTFAGTINYMHQLEGMILYPLDNLNLPSEEEVQSLSSDYIYCILPYSIYDETKYYYRASTYKFDFNIDYQYELIDKTTEIYHPNCYFTLPNNTTFNVDNLSKDLGNTSYDNNLQYYKRLLPGLIYKNVGVRYNFNDPDFDFYYRVGSNYIIDTTTNFTPDRQYYLNHLTWHRQVSIDEIVNPNKHYYMDVSRGSDSQKQRAEALYESWMFELGFRPTDDTIYQDKIYYSIQRGVMTLFTGWTINDSIPSEYKLFERDEINSTSRVRDLYCPPELNVGNYLTENSIEFKASYTPNTYWYFSIDSYKSLTVDGPLYPIYTYQRDSSKGLTDDRLYYTNNPMSLGNNVYFYRPGEYVYFEGENEHRNDHNDYESAIRDNNLYPTLGRCYYAFVLGNPHYIWYIDASGVTHQILAQDIIGLTPIRSLISITEQYIINDESTGYTNVLTPETPAFNYYYKDNNDSNEIYHMLYSATLQNDILSSNHYSFYSLYAGSYLEATDLYIANKYYYFDPSPGRDLLLDTSITLTPRRAYYALSSINNPPILDVMEPVYFYEPNKYYVKQNNLYILLTEETNEDITRRLYEKDVYRVYEDLLGYYSKGAAWNNNLNIVPCSVTLGITTPWYELREIGEVSQGTNSLNGLILKYNKILADNDTVTRNINSIQGTMNLYQDMVRKIDNEMIPDKLITSDYYGRITTTNYSIDDLLKRIAQLEARVNQLENT